MHDNEETKVANLFVAMQQNLNDARRIYDEAVALKLQNTQEFLNWQDGLNAVSITKDEDA